MTRRAGLLLVFLPALFARGEDQREDAAFHTESKVVQVPVSVTDARGHSVEGLAAADFIVLSDGVRQQITLDSLDTGVAKISLVVAIQTSEISKPALTKIQRIGGMFQPLVTGTEGEVAVVSFDDHITWLQDFTHDSAAIENSIRNLKPGAYKQARMFDAISEIADHMKQRPGRRILLLISETRDRGSQLKLADAMEAAGREGLEIFGAYYSAYATTWIARPEDLPAPEGPDFLAVFTELGRLGSINAMDALTQYTGGRDYPFLKERGIESSVEKLGTELHSQYLLSFTPSDNKKGLHRIDVSIVDRGDLHVHARKSWWP
jgi:VWFA-related protein